MVLTRKLLITVITIALFQLSACETISSLNAPTSKATIIPAQTTPKVNTPAHTSTPSKDISNNLPTGILLTSLLEKAHKTLNLQQWLKAQRILEKAVRISPDNAAIYLLYGDLYGHLAVPEQAIEMYRKAIFLAEKGSETFRLASKKLDVKLEEHKRK